MTARFLSLCLFCLCLLPLLSLGQVNLNQGLVAYYPFDGNGNDASGNNHNGTLQGNLQPATDRFGQSGKALAFDGQTGFIKVPDAGAFSTPSFSFSSWVYTENEILQTIIGKRDFGTSNNSELHLTVAGGNNGAFRYFLVGNNRSCNEPVDLGTTGDLLEWEQSVCQRRWYHLAITFANGVQKLYVNGKLAGIKNAVFTNRSICKTELRFGNWWQGDPAWFKGRLDDARWYNRELNAGEISALVQTPTLPNNIDLHANTCTVAPCDRWLKLGNQPSFVRVGDLDITGNKLTVEATFNRTAPWNGSDLFQGDLVSKHEGPEDANYLLRPGSAEITTTTGYYKTPEICAIKLNKTYHVAMVYDGQTLRFYRNGFLMSQVAASGDLLTNDWQTQIGLYYNQVTQEQMIGYINEVRIWNTARTLSQIQAYMNQPLPAPQTAAGLQAYYQFDNLENKQGNANWNGTLFGSAAIVQTNPACAFVADSCNQVYTVPEIPCSDFKKKYGLAAADEEFIDVAATADAIYTVAHTNAAGNQDLVITKMTSSGQLLWSKSVGGEGNEWARKISTAPDGGLLLTGQTRSFDTRGEILCLKLDGSGNVVWQKRFGLGSNNGDLGMDIIATSDGGYAVNSIIDVIGTFADMAILKLDGQGNIQWSKRFGRHDGVDGAGLVQEGNELVVASDLQNSGGHYEFALTRLRLSDGVILGARKYTPLQSGLFNPYIYKDPSGAGFLVSGHTINFDNYNTMKHTVLTLSPDLDLVGTRTVVVSPQANNFYTGFYPLPDGSFLGCASPQGSAPGYVYRVKADNTVMYAYKLVGTGIGKPARLTLNATHVIVGATLEGTGRKKQMVQTFSINGTKAESCTVEPIDMRVEAPAFMDADYTWPSVSTPVFPNPQTQLPVASYHQSSAEVCPRLIMPKDSSICAGNGITLEPRVSGTANTPRWSPANGLSDAGQWAPVARPFQTTRYFLTYTYGQGCQSKDSVLLVVKPAPVVSLTKDTSICAGNAITLNASGGNVYQWAPVPGLSSYNTASPIATPAKDTRYVVTVTNQEGCTARDSVLIKTKATTRFSLKASKTDVCVGDTVELLAAGGSRYTWLADGVVTTSGQRRIQPAGLTRYGVVIEETGCNRKDTLFTTVNGHDYPIPVVRVENDINCTQPSTALLATGGEQYTWTPATSLSNPNIANPIASPERTTDYTVAVANRFGCSILVTVTVKVIAQGDRKFFVPNAFTPNNDGLNDRFGLKQAGAFRNFSLVIFNRWGQELFRTSDPQRSWDGTFLGSPAPAGVYVYQMEGKSLCGELDKKGSFVLIR